MSTRLPVRLGLGDPRLQSYMISAKPTPSTSSSATAAMAASSSSFGRQDRIPAVGVTAPGGSYPSDSSNSHHRAIPPFHPPSSSPSISAAPLLARSTPDQSSGRTYPESPSMRQASISHSNNGQWNESKAATAGGRHSTSPGSQPRSLPSPTPSMTPMSPDWQLVGRQSHDPSPQQQHPQQHRTHQQHDLLSPSASEMELGSDTKPLTPLFRSNSPPVFNSISHRSSLSASHLGPAHMTNSLSAASSGSAGASGVVHPNPTLDHRAVTPPATSLGWSAKHHHHRIPVRSPDRAGHEVMTTSTTDSEPSAYMNMNFYDIYRQNPKLLRPEGGRHEERRLQAFHHHQANSHYHPHPHPDSAYAGDYSRPIGHAKRSSAGGFSGLSRRQSMPLISTATQRVLRHEDAKVEQQMSYDEHVDDIAVKQDPDYHYHGRHNGLGIQQQSTYTGAYKHTSVIPSVQARPAPMSIHHILSDDTTHGSEQDRFSFRSDDDDDEEMDRYSETMGQNYGHHNGAAPYSSSSKASQKRKQDENDGEPKKRKRISKKQAAEMGCQAQAHQKDPRAWLRLTHRRVVQEPEEVVVLEPDVGPVSMLDHQSLPKIIWKGYPLNISGKIGFELLHPYEVHIASTLRLSPAQYLACKRTLILASRKYLSVPNGKQFKKSDAQKLCRIDVNKTSRLWEIFAKVGWLAGITEQDL
ncbi:hypothetical protein BGZ90_006373 [Linnemannia elongata]|nr:hypothetical protein BGZ90_006373 [Linnemannia elongata]